MLNMDFSDPEDPREHDCKCCPSPFIPQFTQGVRQKGLLRTFLMTNTKYN